MVLISVHYPWIQSNNVINIYSNNTTCCNITFQCKHCYVSSQNCQLVLCLFSLWHMILVVRLCCWCWYSFMNVTHMTAGWLIERCVLRNLWQRVENITILTLDFSVVSVTIYTVFVSTDKLFRFQEINSDKHWTLFLKFCKLSIVVKLETTSV